MKQFEFDSDQDEPIAELGRAMQSFGGLMLLTASLGSVGVMVSLLALSFVSKAMALLGVVAVVAQFLSNWQLVGAGRTLIEIPRTDGSDLPLLMKAMRRMAAVNRLQVLGMVLGWGLVAIVLVRLA
jgi:hypothetical protein